MVSGDRQRPLPPMPDKTLRRARYGSILLDALNDARHMTKAQRDFLRNALIAGGIKEEFLQAFLGLPKEAQRRFMSIARNTKKPIRTLAELMQIKK